MLRQTDMQTFAFSTWLDEASLPSSCGFLFHHFFGRSAIIKASEMIIYADVSKEKNRGTLTWNYTKLGQIFFFEQEIVDETASLTTPFPRNRARHIAYSPNNGAVSQKENDAIKYFANIHKPTSMRSTITHPPITIFFFDPEKLNGTFARFAFIISPSPMMPASGMRPPFNVADCFGTHSRTEPNLTMQWCGVTRMRPTPVVTFFH